MMKWAGLLCLLDWIGNLYMTCHLHSQSIICITINNLAWRIIDEAMASSFFTFIPCVVRYFKTSFVIPSSLQTLASTGKRQHCIRMRRHLSSLTVENPHFKPLSVISSSSSGSIASKEDPIILGIETSCDDTAAAVVGFWFFKKYYLQFWTCFFAIG